MSKEGIRIFASVLSEMQDTRRKLLELGSQATLKKRGSGNQDIRLAQLIDDAKDAIKKDFCKITMEE